MNAPARPVVQREPFVWSTTAKLMTLAVLAYSVWVLAQIDITPERLAIGLKQGAKFVSRMFPPDLSKMDILWKGMAESLEIAVLATVQGIIVAVALSDWRPVAAHFLLPLAGVLLAVGSASLRLADPRDPQLAPSSRAVHTLRWAGPVSMVVVFGVMAYAALDGGALPPNLVLAGAGLLLMVTGNVLGKLRPNDRLGIRTRWTLAHARVWDQTHRFSGKAQAAAGFVLLGLAFTPLPPVWHAPVVALVALTASGASVLRSWLLWRALPPASREPDAATQRDA